VAVEVAVGWLGGRKGWVGDDFTLVIWARSVHLHEELLSGKRTKRYYKKKNMVLEEVGTMAQPLFRVLPMVLCGGGVPRKK